MKMKIGKNPYRALEKRLGYRFRRRKMLEAALTHPSFRVESGDDIMDNQRLEFLGDAVLGMAAAAHFYREMSDIDEGKLTSLRSQITRGRALAGLARELGVGAFLRMGRGEEGSGGRDRASNLEDALEAVIGAIYLDGGFKAAQKVFRRVFVPVIEALSDDIWAGNPKGKLQEFSQRRWKESPLYAVLSQEGPPHATTFTVSVTLRDGRSRQGKGRSKQDAERRAARTLLESLGNEAHDPEKTETTGQPGS
jgi:ribonuclease III